MGNNYSTKSDSFAVGVFLFNIASRKFPWKGKDKAELIQSYLKKQPNSKYIQHLPPRAKHLILALVDTNW
jgi:hypothetical protein